ncbi:glycosyl hydrolases family 28-domain-containing protein [Kalaharituber pfeilii]|nr:glycosyl hydrolases family 28-domain-containing protein [Kalaharituber pfeilii]
MCDVVEKAEGGRIRISAGFYTTKRGVRTKTVYSATGSISNFTYADITLKNITKYGIVIEQDYQNGSPMATGKSTSGVPISNVTLKDVKGTVTSSLHKRMYSEQVIVVGDLGGSMGIRAN